MEHFRDVDTARVAWGLVGVVLVGLVAVVARPFVGTLAFAVFLYYATRPVYRRVHERVGTPSIAATVTLVAVALPALLVVGYASVVAAQNLNDLFQSADLQQYQSLVQPYIDVSTVLRDPMSALSRVRDSQLPASQAGLAAVLTSLGAYVGAVFAVLLRLFLVFAFTFYLLRDDERLAAWFLDTFGTDQARLDGRPLLSRYADAVDDDLQTVYFGNLVLIAINGAIAVVVYLALNLVAPAGAGIPYPVLLGLLTGVGSLVPAVGMKIVYAPIGILLLATAVVTGSPLWFPVAYLLAAFVVVDTIPDFFVRAYVSGRSLHTGLVMFAYVLGSVVFGWYGIFLGPLVLVLVLHFGRLVLPRVAAR